MIVQHADPSVVPRRLRSAKRDDVMRAMGWSAAASSGAISAPLLVKGTPATFTKTAIWLRGDLGLTVTYPTIPGHLVAGGYSATLCTLTDSADGSADSIVTTATTGQHDAGKTLSTTLSGTTPTVIVVRAKPLGSYHQIQVQLGGLWVRFELNDGSVISTSAGASGSASAVDGSGYRTLTVTITGAMSGTVLRFIVCSGGTNSFAADGTSGIYVDAANLTVTQGGAVSDWANQGHDTTRLASVPQATFANRPCTTTSGIAGLYFGSTTTTNMAATFASSITQPWTWFVAFKTASSLSGQKLILDGIDVTNRHFLSTYSTTSTMRVGAATGTNGTTTVSGSQTIVYAMLANGASSATWFNGAAELSTNLGSAGMAGLTVGNIYSLSGFNFDGVIYEIVGYNGNASTDGAFTPITNYLRARYGV